MQTSRLAQAAFKSIVPSALLPALVGVLLVVTFGDQKWVHEPIHSFLEALGSMAAFNIGVFILLLLRNRQIEGQYAWVAVALLTMGLFDGFHSCVHPGKNFVWLHSLANFSGGVLICLVAFNTDSFNRQATKISSFGFFAAFFLGTVSIVADGWVPEMVFQGQFTSSARMLNVIGGIGFVYAWWTFTLRYSSDAGDERLVLANHCLLFGIAGLLFELSALWDSVWWLWHVLRAVAYLVLLVYFFVVFKRQIGSLLTAHSQLDQSNSDLNNAQRIAKMGNWSLEYETGELTWSDQVYRMCGVDPENFALSHSSAIELVHPDDQADLSAKLELASLGEAYSTEFRLVRKNGEILNICHEAEPVFDEQGKCTKVKGIARDITSQKRHEEALELARIRSEKANKAKGMFLANMSHEIRTPINALTGINYLITKTDLTAKQREYVDKARSATDTLSNLVNDILDFSKIESGEMKLEQVSFNIENILNRLADLFVFQSHQKGLELLFFLEPDMPKQLIGDPVRLAQILRNLVSNAIKFSDSGEIVVRGQLAANQNGLLDEQVRLEFFVSDRGIGIKEEAIERLFQDFTQADSSTTREYGGTGLGLAISRRLVSMMKGDINVQSNLGRGSVFSLDPVFVLEENPGEKSPILEFTGLKVLVVDDNMAALEVVSSMLNAWGVEVLEARSAAEALGLFAQLSLNGDVSSVDAVLTDYKMPVMDGLQLIGELQRLYKYTSQHIIMISALDREETRSKVSAAGVSQYLTKPVFAGQLYNSLAHVMGRDPIAKMPITKLESHIRSQVEQFAGARILLVEDQPINQMVAREILEGLNLVVELAEDGQKALDLLVENPERFDLVFMDLHMPQMNGKTATQKIRQTISKAELPIIGMTADARVSEKEICFSLGMNDYLPKPIDVDGLIQCMAHWIKPGHRELPENSNTSESRKDEGRLFEGVSLDSISLEQAMRQLGGNAELLQSIIVQFYHSQKKGVGECWSSLHSGDLQHLSELVHSISGVSGNIAAQNLHQAAKALELASLEEEPDLEQLALLMTQFEKRHQETLESAKLIVNRVELEANSVSSNDPQEGTLNQEALAQKLNELRSLLEQKNLMAMNLFKEIKSSLIQFKLQIDPLEKHVDQLEFEEGVISLDQLYATFKQINL